MKYKILSDTNIFSLEKSVEGYLKEGWKISGGVTVLPTSRYPGAKYFQTIYREEEQILKKIK